MSMNHFGKGLVLLHLCISLLAMTWAAALFLQFTDLGWKEPRKNLELRTPSEYDKRAAALRESYRVVAGATPFLKKAQKNLGELEPYRAQNYLWYKQELARLQNDPNPIEVKEIKFDQGALVLDTAGKPFGRPQMGAKIEGLEKSQAAYETDLKKIHQEIANILKETSEWLEKQKDVTEKLNGPGEKGKVEKRGLYVLLENEKKAQDQARFEIEYLTPLWVSAKKEAEELLQRRQRLQKTLAGLQAATPGR